MSVRPRPVTATFPPSPLYSPQPRYDHYTLSSADNSTESLLSVLRHSSYESLGIASEAPRSVSRLDRDLDRGRGWSARRHGHSRSQSGYSSSRSPRRQVVGSARSHDNVTSDNSRNSVDLYGSSTIKPIFQRRSGVVIHEDQLHDAQIRSVSAPAIARNMYRSSPELSEHSEQEQRESRRLARRTAWEQWVVSKEKEQRQRAEEEAERKRKEEEVEAKKRAVKEERRKKGEVVVRQWMDERKESEMKQKQNEKEKIRQEQEKKEADKAQVNAKADLAFQAWQKKKAEETASKKAAEKKKKEKEKELKEIKKKENEEKYQKWLTQAKLKQKKKPNRTSSVIGCYDDEIHPPPSFVNPIPWHHIEVPNTPDSPVVGKSSRRYTSTTSAIQGSISGRHRTHRNRRA